MNYFHTSVQSHCLMMGKVWFCSALNNTFFSKSRVAVRKPPQCVQQSHAQLDLQAELLVEV